MTSGLGAGAGAGVEAAGAGAGFGAGAATTAVEALAECWSPPDEDAGPDSDAQAASKAPPAASQTAGEKDRRMARLRKNVNRET